MNIHLLPIAVEVRWRRRPLPPFRVRFRGLMLAVAVAALGLALVAQLARLDRAARHHAQAALDAPGRTANGGDSDAGAWHEAMAQLSRANAELVDVLLFLFFLAIASLMAVAALGRAIDRWSRRPKVSPEARTPWPEESRP